MITIWRRNGLKKMSNNDITNTNEIRENSMNVYLFQDNENFA